MPALTRPLVSTVGNVTKAEPTNEKHTNIRGSVASSRDFKIKSIDGLKLTVKTDTLKRKKTMDSESPVVEQRKFRIDTSKLVKKMRAETDSDNRKNVQVSYMSSHSLKFLFIVPY